MPRSIFASFPALSRSVFAVGLLAAASACTRDAARTAPAPLPTARPLLASLGAPTRDEIARIGVSVRFPSVTPWTATLAREPAGAGSAWSVRPGDGAGGAEPADDALIAHFLETLETLVVEAEAGAATDESLGFKPHRIELRLETATSAAAPLVLRFGDPIGGVGLFFRREGESRAWITRGAWLALLPLLQSPDAFARKAFWNGAFAGIRRVRVEKRLPPNAGRWEFNRDATAPDGAIPSWRQGARTLTAAEAATLERILRQRVRSRSAGTEALGAPDWTISVAVEGTPEQVLDVHFPLDRVVGRAPSPGARTLEFYPEFAGALRAFTQSRFTPVKSFTK